MLRSTSRGLVLFLPWLFAGSLLLAAGPLQTQQGRMGIGTRLDAQDKALARHDQELGALRGELSEVRAELNGLADRLEHLGRQSSPPPPPPPPATSSSPPSGEALAGVRQQIQALDAALEVLQRQVRQLRPRGGGAPAAGASGGDCCAEVNRLREYLADVRLMLETQAGAMTQLELDVRRLAQDDALAQLTARATELRQELEAELEQLGQGFDFKHTDDGGFLEVKNRNSQPAGSLYASAQGSALELNNPQGERRLLLTVSERGSGEAYFYDAEGGIKLWLSGDGSIRLNGREVKDHAEVFELAQRDGVVPGTVLAITDDGRLAPTTAAYDPRVIGVVSGAGGLRPGLVLGTREDGTSDLPVALNGQVYVRISSEGGAVSPGDLLVPSGRPGVAMRAADRQRAFGAVLGKALESFEGGENSAPGSEGLVRMLVMVR